MDGPDGPDGVDTFLDPTGASEAADVSLAAVDDEMAVPTPEGVPVKFDVPR